MGPGGPIGRRTVLPPALAPLSAGLLEDKLLALLTLLLSCLLAGSEALLSSIKIPHKFDRLQTRTFQLVGQ